MDITNVKVATLLTKGMKFKIVLKLNANPTAEITAEYAFILKASGVVEKATNWGTVDKPNWYIEFKHDNESPIAAYPNAYGYYKQELDFGGNGIVIVEE